jgi:hypothetical protein
MTPPSNHAGLLGKEAGGISPHHSNSGYWVIRLNGKAMKRSHVIFLCATGLRPSMIDHINGDSLDDGISNLREVTVTQNAWNHRSRRKKEKTPMGVRILPSGKFQARIACHRKTLYLGVFDTAESANAAYLAKRVALFGEYSGVERTEA